MNIWRMPTRKPCGCVFVSILNVLKTKTCYRASAVPASEYPCARGSCARRLKHRMSPRGDGWRPAAWQTADGQAIAQSPKRDTYALSAARTLLGNVLVPAVLGERFLAVEAERLDHRPVVDRKEDGVFLSGVGVLVQRPRRKRQDVALAPVVGLAVDDGAALSLRDAEHGAAGDPPSPQPLAGTDELYPAAEGRQHRAAGLRMRVFERHAFIRRAIAIAQSAQRRRGLLPGIDEERRDLRDLLHPGRREAPVAVHRLGAIHRLGRRHLPLAVHLEEDAVERLGERHVEPVHPHHGLAGLVA